MNKRLMIKGMSCQHCVMRVRKTLEGLDGIEEVKVDLDAGYAEIQDLKGLSEDELVAAIDEAGYDVTNIEEL